MGFLAMAYSVIVYFIFFGGFLYFIAFLGGDALSFLDVPKTIDAGGSVLPGGSAVLINLALLVAFGVQHSVMARPGFKRAWTKIVPKAMERSTYVLASVLMLILLYTCWQPMPEVIWSIETPLWRTFLVGAYFAGIGLVFISTFAINHFDMFGLMQGWLQLRKKEEGAPEFRVPFLYSIVRHPLYLGFLIAFWATPHMTAGHLLFAAIWTAYVFIAVGYEERDLIAVFGDKYLDYMKKTPSIIPIGRRK